MSNHASAELPAILALLVSASVKMFYKAVHRFFDSEDPTQFQLVLSHACTFSGLTVAELTDELGVSASTVSRWIAGKGAPAKHSRRHIVEHVASLALARSSPSIAEHVAINLADPKVFEQLVARARSNGI